MDDYWVPYVYCRPITFIGEFFMYIVSFSIRIWYLLAGITIVKSNLYLIFVTTYVYYEELFINYLLTSVFKDIKPDCHVYSLAIISGARGYGLPSFEAQMLFSMSTFLLLHRYITEKPFRNLFFWSLSIFPIICCGILYVTYNNTKSQLIFGALVGIINGVRKVLFYHLTIYEYRTTVKKWVSLPFLGNSDTNKRKE